MAQTVRAYIAKHGAAPDFRLGRPGDREKVCNYIRSTTAQQQAPDELVENVRCILIN